jgi:hypothetical protein
LRVASQCRCMALVPSLAYLCGWYTVIFHQYSVVCIVQWISQLHHKAFSSFLNSFIIIVPNDPWIVVLLVSLYVCFQIVKWCFGFHISDHADFNICQFPFEFLVWSSYTVWFHAGAAVGPLLAGVVSNAGWQYVFYMLMTANVLALLVRYYLLLFMTVCCSESPTC